MKLAFILLICACAVFGAPDKRFFVDSLSGFDLTHLKQLLQSLLNTLGTDATEQLCETECHTLLTDPAHLLHYSCGLVCHAFQSLVHRFNLAPQTGTVG
ncbi:hypothetical protein ACJMK2_023339 [Sinanodonta woodiana]|uniref:Uncharacterized protein n=1 Tax=Sinanodonta woodiana TaxID=1069815 RepID=A0ABD3T3W7_SINWO